MAEITYDNLNMELVVWYNGTVSKFESEVYTLDSNSKPVSLNQKSSQLKEYADKVILITGSTEPTPDTAGKAQAIFISKTNANGAIEGKLMKLSDIPGYIAGINVGGSDYEADGNVILKLVGLNGISINVNPAGTVNFDASSLVEDIEDAAEAAAAADGKAQNALNEIAALKGESGDGTIAEIVGNAIEGVIGEDDDDVNDVTIKGVKNTAAAINEVLFGTSAKNPVTGDKIKTSVLPDVIMGQLKFGGTIGNDNNKLLHNEQNIRISPTTDFDTIYKGNKVTYQVTSSTFDPKDYPGWYFIVAKPALVPDGVTGSFSWPLKNSATLFNDFTVGDWFLSTGEAWEKIDNTDAVVRVAGMQGDITTKNLVDTLSTYDPQTNTGPLAKKSEISLKSVKANDDSKEYISVITDKATKEATIAVETASMQDVIGEFIQGNDALATANDVFNFIKARLSIKVVSSN